MNYSKLSFYTLSILLIFLYSTILPEGDPFSGYRFKGTFSRVLFNQKSIDAIDVIDSLEIIATRYSSRCPYYIGRFSIKDSCYYIKEVKGNDLSGGNSRYIYIRDSKGAATGIEWQITRNMYDYPNDVKYYELFSIPVQTGTWIISDSSAVVFYHNNGTKEVFNFWEGSDLTFDLGLYSIIGNIGDKSFAIFKNNENKFLFFKVALNNSPALDFASSERLYFDDNAFPLKLFPLNDSIFIVKTFNCATLRIYELQKDTLHFIKEVDGPSLSSYKQDWYYKNDKLYYINNGINAMDYDRTRNSFSNNRRIFSGSISDQNFNYAVDILNDSIIIFDINKENLYNTIDINGMYADFYSYFIEYPYVYINSYKFDDIRIEENEQEELTYKLSAYPNPFNPQTTIAFTIPNAGKVELAVYDLLGRKVTELLNEYRDKGSYEIKFNGSNLASGIYFYTIRAGSFVKTEKLMLLK